MKKILLSFAAIAAISCLGRPHHFGPHYGPRMPPPPPPRHHIHHRHMFPPTTIYLNPLAIPIPARPIWVPPVYRSVPIYDTYGNFIRFDQVLVTPGYWR